MKKKLLTGIATITCLTMLLSGVMSLTALALDETLTSEEKVTLSKDSILPDGGFEKASVGKEKTIDWMMPIAGKFEVVENSSLAIEGKKLIKAAPAQDVRIALPEVKDGYKIKISFYYKNENSNGLWSKLKDIDNKETIVELTGANGFTNGAFNSGWHHVTERISVGEAGVATIVPGEYHYAMGCFGEAGYIYFDAFEIVVEDENGKVVTATNDNPISIFPYGKKSIKVKVKKKVVLKYAAFGFKGSKKVTCKTSNKKVVKIVKKKKKSVVIKTLKKGKAKLTFKQGKKKATLKVIVKK